MVVERATWEQARAISVPDRTVPAAAAAPLRPSANAAAPLGSFPFSGYLLKRREHLNFIVEQWRPRWVVIQGRELRYFSTPSDTAPRDVIRLEKGTIIEMGWRKGQSDAASSAAATENWAWASKQEGRIVTPTRPEGPYPDARLAILRIWHPDAPKKVYQFAWLSPSGESDDAAAVAREQARRWVAVMRAAADGWATAKGTALQRPVESRARTASTISIADIERSKAAAGSDLPQSTSSLPPPLMMTSTSIAKITEAPANPVEAIAVHAAVAADSENSTSASSSTTPRPLPRRAWPPGHIGDKCQAIVADLRRLANDNGGGMWTPNGRTRDVECWRTSDGTPGARGDARIPFSRAVVLATLLDSSERPRYDPQGIEGRRVASIDLQTHYIYLNFRGFPFVSGRDFCLFSHYRVDADGTVWIATVSSAHDDVPPRDGIVRAKVLVGGWVLRPVPPVNGVEVACDATYAMRSDLCGSLPVSITSKVTASQAILVGNLRDYLCQKHQGAVPRLPAPRNVAYDEFQAAADDAIATPPRQSSPTSPVPPAAVRTAFSPPLLTPKVKSTTAVAVPTSPTLVFTVIAALLLLPVVIRFLGVGGLLALALTWPLWESFKAQKAGPLFRAPLAPTPQKPQAAIALRAAAAAARTPKNSII
jgi:hypothetical protein